MMRMIPLLHATVVGVVNDYVYGDMYGKPDPVIFFCTSPRFENTHLSAG